MTLQNTLDNETQEELGAQHYLDVMFNRRELLDQGEAWVVRVGYSGKDAKTAPNPFEAFEQRYERSPRRVMLGAKYEGPPVPKNVEVVQQVASHPKDASIWLQ